MKDPDTTELSNCHHAPVRVEGRATKSYYCNQCNKACDLWVRTDTTELHQEILDWCYFLAGQGKMAKAEATALAIEDFITKREAEAYRAGQIAALEAFRANTGQYEIERDYSTPTGHKNWNIDIKIRNKLKMSLDNKIKHRLAELQSDNGEEVS